MLMLQSIYMIVTYIYKSNRLPFTRKETLPLGNNSSHRSIHNSSVFDNQRNEIKTSI